jgi:hypothetical protein
VGASGSIGASVAQPASVHVAREEGGDEVEMTELVDQDRHPWWLRLRAVVGLVVIVVCLGVTAAAAVGLTALALASLVDHALG